MITLTSMVFNCMCSKGRNNVSDIELTEYAKSVGWTGATQDLLNLAESFREYPEMAKQRILDELYRD